MGSGNGNKAQLKRERNLKKAQSGVANSQLKTNEKAMNIMCTICRQTFMCNSKIGDWKAHFDAKHPKGFTFEQAFPNAA